MLNAIVNGKAGRTKEDIKAGTSWRAAFHGREDLLTASVFERLSYLPGPIFWEILEKSFQLSGFSDDGKLSKIQLEHFEFWPRFNLVNENKNTTYRPNYREPDAFIQFSYLGVKSHIDIILEAKPDDRNGQSQGQWDKQCEAYLVNHFGEAKRVLYFAIGGLGYSTEKFNELRKQLKAKYPDIEFYGSSWARLMHVVKNMRDSGVDSNIKLILNDVLQALSLAGYREVVPLGTLESRRLFRRLYLRRMKTLKEYLHE